MFDGEEVGVREHHGTSNRDTKALPKDGADVINLLPIGVAVENLGGMEGGDKQNKYKDICFSFHLQRRSWKWEEKKNTQDSGLVAML